jgi:hypothetical protein
MAFSHVVRALGAIDPQDTRVVSAMINLIPKHRGDEGLSPRQPYLWATRELEAAEVLLKSRQPKALESLLPIFASTAPWSQRRVYRHLRRYGDESLAKPLLERLDILVSFDFATWDYAFALLKHWNVPRGRLEQLVISRLDSNSVDRKWSAVNGLAALRTPFANLKLADRYGRGTYLRPPGLSSSSDEILSLSSLAGSHIQKRAQQGEWLYRLFLTVVMYKEIPQYFLGGLLGLWVSSRFFRWREKAAFRDQGSVIIESGGKVETRFPDWRDLPPEQRWSLGGWEPEGLSRFRSGD